jgi:hypothetical protein
MKTKTILATTAIAALAVPAAAGADKPANPGSQGKGHAKRAHKVKGVGFTLAGTKVTGLSVADGKLSGPLTLDPTSANKHARTFLQLSKADVAGDKTVSLGTAGDAILVKLHGLKPGDALTATDRVKVIGKLTGSTLDIRKLTITRRPPKADEPKPEQPKATSKSDDDDKAETEKHDS